MLCDEKDYFMRVIKEMVRVLFSLMLGKEYRQVEQEKENKYQVSGITVEELKTMADKGEINHAEDLMLNCIDYSNKEEIAAAACFYRYISEKEEEFLEENNYSQQEVLEGLQQLAEKAGYGEIFDII